MTGLEPRGCEKLAFLVDSLGHSQLAYSLTRRLNALAAERVDLDVVCFVRAPARPCLVPHFAVMPEMELWGFDGAAVATDLRWASALLGCPTVKRKFFYLWDLEWLRPPARPRAEFAAAYQSPALALAARNADHARAVESAWGRRPLVSEDCDPAPFLECPP